MINLTIQNFIDLIPKYVFDVAETLQKNNYEAYLVGGSIRDVLLGKKPNDFDIATNAYPEKIEAIFEKSIPTGAKFGTITVVTPDEAGETHDVQITTYRSEADYVGGRWPAKVEFTKTVEEDLSRRDFTINAIALNLQKFDEPDLSIQKVLIDPFNGLEDLERGIIKAVRDPMERFSEDGLRPVRAARLASQLDFQIAPNTLEAMKKTNHITKQISIERFRDELMKILLKSPKPSKGLRILAESGILEIFIPELLEGKGITQPQYHTDDVFDHSLETADVAEDSIKLAALFHDIGKVRTMTKDEKGTHFYGHDMKGAEMTREILTRLRFPNEVIEKVVKLIRWHMFYYPSADWRKLNGLEDKDESNIRHGWSDGAIRRLIKEVGGEEAIDNLMKLRIADADANPKNDFDPIELDKLSERIAEVRAKEMALKVTDLDIDGTELMKELNITPGKQLGNVLNFLLDRVIEEPLDNERGKLIGLAREYLKRS